jgi:hypothetical protein
VTLWNICYYESALHTDDNLSRSFMAFMKKDRPLSQILGYTAITVQYMVVWVVTLCSLIGGS